MSFNFSYSFGFMTQTDTYPNVQGFSPGALSSNVNISGNIKVKYYPVWYKHIVVEWSVPADWGACVFNVYFAPTQEGPFVRINPATINGTYLLDSTTQEYSKFGRGFYIVEAILTEKGNVAIQSVASSWDNRQNDWVQLRSNEIQRREFLLLSRFSGIKSYLFKRKAYGQRCPECWSYETEKVTKDNCTTCFGTSFTGGYFSPAATFIQYDATPDSNSKTYFGKFEQNQIQGWTISFPEMRPDDIIFRVGDWSMYRIDGVQATEMQGKPVRQIMKLTQLSKGDIEYQLLATGIPEFPAEFL